MSHSDPQGSGTRRTPVQCIRCPRITNYMCMLNVEDARVMIGALRQLDVPRAVLISLVDRAYPYDDGDPRLREWHSLVLAMCQRCAEQTDTPVDRRQTVLHRIAVDEDVPGIIYGYRTLASAQGVWDRQQALIRDISRDRVECGTPVAGTGGSLIDGLPKDIRRLVKPALRDGWEPSMDGKGHVRFTKGDQMFTAPATPSDRRTVQNLRDDAPRRCARRSRSVRDPMVDVLFKRCTPARTAATSLRRIRTGRRVQIFWRDV